MSNDMHEAGDPQPLELEQAAADVPTCPQCGGQVFVAVPGADALLCRDNGAGCGSNWHATDLVGERYDYLRFALHSETAVE